MYVDFVRMGITSLWRAKMWKAVCARGQPFTLLALRVTKQQAPLVSGGRSMSVLQTPGVGASDNSGPCTLTAQP